MHFDLELAEKLWTEVYAGGYDGWICENEAIRIAAMCGLGVLSVRARTDAVNCIRQDYRKGGRYSRELFAQLKGTDFAVRWARSLLVASERFPTPVGYYPICRPEAHEVGKAPCFGMARKGAWSDECYRAAWGNIEPFGLDAATKNCPACGHPMHYWCWGRQGDAAFRWSIDHVIPHAKGGCTCHFNLKALHPGCNSSKGTKQGSQV